MISTIDDTKLPSKSSFATENNFERPEKHTLKLKIVETNLTLKTTQQVSSNMLK